MLGNRFVSRLPLAAIVVGLLALVTGLALEARADQRRSVADVEERFHQRIDLAADYVVTHLDDMRRRQVAYAERELSGLVTATGSTGRRSASASRPQCCSTNEA